MSDYEKLAIARGALRFIARWCDDKGLAALALETWAETRPDWLQERMDRTEERKTHEHQ